MKYVIDRIENEIAILESIEDNSIIEISISNLPECIKEGDIILKEETFSLLKEETTNRKKSIEDRFNNLISED